MADNSRMGNVSQVETYGKNLKKVEGQVRDVFKKLQQSTCSVGNVWDDDHVLAVVNSPAVKTRVHVSL